MKTNRKQITTVTRWSLVVLGLAVAAAGEIICGGSLSAAAAGGGEAGRLAAAQLQRDLVSGYHGHLDALLQDPKSRKFLLQPENNDFVTRADNKASRHDKQGRSVPPGPHSWWDARNDRRLARQPDSCRLSHGRTQVRERGQTVMSKRFSSRRMRTAISAFIPRATVIISPGPTPSCGRSDASCWDCLAYYEFTDRKDVLDAVQRAVKLTHSPIRTGAVTISTIPGRSARAWRTG